MNFFFFNFRIIIVDVLLVINLPRFVHRDVKRKNDTLNTTNRLIAAVYDHPVVSNEMKIDDIIYNIIGHFKHKTSLLVLSTYHKLY